MTRMFWGDRIVEEVLRRYDGVLKSGQPLVIRDEKTASGRVHIGSLRSAALHAVVAEGLAERGIPHTFLFEINDFDPMDGLPSYLDERVYREHLGRQLYKIPAPEPGAKNFAEFYGEEYVGVMRDAGFTPQIYRASELYLSGRMNDAIRRTLERRDVVRKIYKEVSGGERPETWYPLNVVCEQCGKISTTVVTGFDGALVTYECRKNAVAWTEGCGHSGTISPFDGNAKLPWKPEWAAKFLVNGVHFEGGGKDHFTRGGAREVAERISREVFDHEPPYGEANEFFLVGGAKMSSSKGNADSAREISDLLPPHILRLALMRSEINRQINFDASGDTIPLLFDHYDKIASKYWSGEAGDDARVFARCHLPSDTTLLEKRYLPRFSQVAFIIQMSHMDIEKEVASMKGGELTEADRTEIALRSRYARMWLSLYAPSAFRFELQDTLPACTLSEEQRQSMRDVLARFENLAWDDPQAIHTALHEIKTASGLTPQDFFLPIYCAFFGRDSGPKAGWFLSTLKKEFVLKRFEELVK